MLSIILELFLIYNASAFPGVNRIVGGQETIIDLHPYQASLQYRSGNAVYSQCGGSIISTKFILTAAHCEPAIGWGDMFYARVGSTVYGKGGQCLKIASFVQHPQYSRAKLDYDYAVVGFSKGVEIILSPQVLIVLLASQNSADPEENSLVTVSGWGVVDEYNTGTDILKTVKLPVFNAEYCRKITPFWTPRHLCLGGTEHGQLSSCFGDSGSPAMQNGVQHALVSGGNSCFAAGIPGIYSKISIVRDWIDKVAEL